VDTWRNGDAEQGVNISGVAGGADVGQLAFTNGVILEDDSRKTGSMSISWNPDTGASFATTGLTTNADFADVATGDFVASDDHTFIISARVGGANQDFFMDNLVIRAGEADFDEDGLSDLAEYNSGASDPTKADSDDDGLTDGEEVEAGTQPLIADTDGDGLNDGAEGEAGTDPLDSDSDDDGYADGVEITVGSDPTDGESTPPSLVAYFDFEDQEGTDVVLDKGSWGNDATVVRPDQTTVGVEGGAPAGASPGTAADFQGGFLNVPGVDMSNVIGGEG
ncbi:MAG: hypothetical protein GY900_00330, partial [Actinomycetia bacterium]|nr:hypothetical protein [Actinomycetes bacterium]